MLCFGLWEIETPDYVIRISKHPTDDLHREFEHEVLKHGFQFFADMINRTVFVFVIFVQVIILMATILPAWVSYGKDPEELQ